MKYVMVKAEYLMVLAPSVIIEINIEYGMRRDTAAPHFEQVPFRGMCLFEADCVVRNANSSFMF